jgi:hypothetical protein
MAQQGKGCRKAGRADKKAKGRTTVLSSFVRNKISAEEYFKKTNQKVK